MTELTHGILYVYVYVCRRGNGSVGSVVLLYFLNVDRAWSSHLYLWLWFSHTHTHNVLRATRWKLNVTVHSFITLVYIYIFNCKAFRLNPFFTVPSSSLTCLVFKDGQEQLKTNKNRMHTSKKFQNLLSHISARYPFGKKKSQILLDMLKDFIKLLV